MAAATPTPAPNANRRHIELVIDAIRNPGNFFSMKQFWVDPDFLTCLDDRLFLKVYGTAKPPTSTPACVAG